MAMLVREFGQEYRSLDIGRVVKATFDTLARNGVAFFTMAAVSVLPTILLNIYFDQFSIAGQSALALRQSTGLHQIIDTPLALLCATLLQVALVHGTLAHLSGHRPTIADCIRMGLKNWPSVIGLSLVLGFAMVIGLALLVVPAILMAVNWCVAVPALVAEETGIMEAFNRSVALVSGCRWTILALVVVYFVIFFILSLVVHPLHNAFGYGPFAQTPSHLAEGLLNILNNTVSSVGNTELYFELRRVKEGFGPDDLAKVFD